MVTIQHVCVCPRARTSGRAAADSRRPSSALDAARLATRPDRPAAAREAARPPTRPDRPAPDTGHPPDRPTADPPDRPAPEKPGERPADRPSADPPDHPACDLPTGRVIPHLYLLTAEVSLAVRTRGPIMMGWRLGGV